MRSILNEDFFCREVLVYSSFECFRYLNDNDTSFKQIFNKNKDFIINFYNQEDTIIDLGNNRLMKTLLNGKVIEQSSYHNSNGIIACEATFVNNIINGYRRFYHRNGKIKHEENFVNGDLHGICKSFDENGILIKSSIYKNGKRVK
jgi:hypothetical protein